MAFCVCDMRQVTEKFENTEIICDLDKRSFALEHSMIELDLRETKKREIGNSIENFFKEFCIEQGPRNG